MTHKYFVYDPEVGFDTYKTEDEAKQSAIDSIDAYRDNADEGWDESVSNVVWGQIKQITIEVKSGVQVEFEGEIVEAVDYQLQDI